MRIESDIRAFFRFSSRMPKVAAQSMKRDDADFGVVLHRIDVDSGAVLRSFELPPGNTKFGRCDASRDPTYFVFVDLVFSFLFWCFC
jgi:hypothetical protein